MEKSDREETPKMMRLPLACMWLTGMCILLTLLAACGDTSSSSGSLKSEPLQACDLLTKADAEAIIGGEVGEPQTRQTEPDGSGYWMSMCNYFSDEKNISLGCLIKPHGRQVTGSEALVQYETELNESLGTDTQMARVADVGDAAGWDKDTRQLTVFQGPLMVIVTSGGRNVQGTSALALSSQAARKILEKLPQ